MEEDYKKKGFRDYKRYIIRAVKFYDLRNENLTRALFVIMLFTSLVNIFIPGVRGNDMASNVISIIMNITVIPLAATIYLVAYLRELRGREYNVRGCARTVFSKAIRIILVYIAYIVLVYSSMMLVLVFQAFILLIIPLAIFLSIFLFFSLCYIVDLGEGITGAFKAARATTKGYTGKIFMLSLVFNLILLIPLLFIVIPAQSSNNIYIFTFVISFISIMVNLMQQRLFALIYMDLEYGYKEQVDKEE